ncbi:glycosyltransferase family 4 protein [Palleronia abyssalis]|nr:glycosyltransferase family 1 protein [Palleronia abyssalis]
MRPDIVFDLTEMLLATTGKLRYYGIVRVVAEIGLALARHDPAIRFCIYSAGHRRFFEIHPVRDADGTVSFDIPEGVRQLRIRSVFHQKKPVRDALAVPFRAIANARNRRAWAKGGVDLPEIPLDGKTYVSCGRPKLMVEQLHAIAHQGWQVTFIPLLHDMIPLHDYFAHRSKAFPSNFVNDNIYILTRARAVLTNSGFTRDELLSFTANGQLPTLSETAVHAIPLVHECPRGTEEAEQLPPDSPYILTVGATLGRKNLDTVFDAVKTLRKDGKTAPRIVVAGARRHRTEKYLASKEMDEVRDLVEFYHSPNQTDLVALYEGAVALVLGSRMEGWGLPAGEALWLGTPVICSTAPVLREVAGDLGLYFDPDRPDELAAHIAHLMDDPEYAKALRARIRAGHARLRTWDDVARDMLHILAEPREETPSGSPQDID